MIMTSDAQHSSSRVHQRLEPSALRVGPSLAMLLTERHDDIRPARVLLVLQVDVVPQSAGDMEHQLAARMRTWEARSGRLVTKYALQSKSRHFRVQNVNSLPSEGNTKEYLRNPEGAHQVNPSPVGRAFHGSFQEGAQDA